MVTNLGHLRYMDLFTTDNSPSWMFLDVVIFIATLKRNDKAVMPKAQVHE